MQGLSHRPRFHDNASRDRKKPLVALAQQPKATVSGCIRSTEMHHERHLSPGTGFHHPHGFKAEIHQHRIGSLATNHPPDHAGSGHLSQSQQPQAGQHFAEQDRQAVGQGDRTAKGPFIAKQGRHLKGQPLNIGADESFADCATGWRQHQQALVEPGRSIAAHDSARTERQWGSTTSQSSARKVVRASIPMRSRSL